MVLIHRDANFSQFVDIDDATPVKLGSTVLDPHTPNLHLKGDVMKIDFKGMITMVLVLVLFAVPAMALDLFLGEDTYGPESWIDIRTYHESHPGSQTQYMRDGWYIGATVLNAKADDIAFAEISISGGKDGAESVIKITKPAVYPWGNELNRDFGAWLSHDAVIGPNVTYTMYGTDGNPVRFIHWDENVEPFTSLTLPCKQDAQVVQPPVVKHMRITKSGDMIVKVKVPFDLRDNHIRMRVFNADNTGLEYQEKIYPPYEIVKKDGTVIPDKIKITVPAEYQGRNARVELRVFEDSFMLRGMQYITLPSLEDEE